MIKDHLYDAGWPRNDSKGCIATWTRDSGPHYARSAHEVCGAPASSHEGTEYLGEPGESRACEHDMQPIGGKAEPFPNPPRDGRGFIRPEDRRRPRPPGDMHEPRAYSGELDWGQTEADYPERH